MKSEENNVYCLIFLTASHKWLIDLFSWSIKRWSLDECGYKVYTDFQDIFGLPPATETFWLWFESEPRSPSQTFLASVSFGCNGSSAETNPALWWPKWFLPRTSVNMIKYEVAAPRSPSRCPAVNEGRCSVPVEQRSAVSVVSRSSHMNTSLC